MTAGRQVGWYTLVERLGQGGMGEVWLAEDRTGAAGGAPRRVALKLLAPALVADASARARFAREVQAARPVRGPTVAALLDADVDAPEPWLASAYVAGPTLQDHVAAHGPLPDAALRSLGLALAEALDAIHEAGVVHRDLTPRNVVLGPDGPRVVDFGIAWFEGAQQVTATGEWVGTPSYMAPERLVSDDVTPAGDVWSWGAVMAYAARGRPLVTGSNVDVVIDRIERGHLDLDGIPAWLAPWVAAALSLEPDDRPEVALLAAAMAGDDVTAPAPPPGATTRDDRPPTRREARSRTRTRRYTVGPSGAVGDVAAGGTYPSGEDPDSTRRGVRGVSVLLVLGAAGFVGWLTPLLVSVMVTAVVLVVAVGLRLAREQLPDGARPIPPTWAVALAGPVVLGVALAQVVGITWAAIILVMLIVVFVLLGGDIG
jgi:serine/threonine protein kinase